MENITNEMLDKANSLYSQISTAKSNRGVLLKITLDEREPKLRLYGNQGQAFNISDSIKDPEFDMIIFGMILKKLDEYIEKLQKEYDEL